MNTKFYIVIAILLYFFCNKKKKESQIIWDQEGEFEFPETQQKSIINHQFINDSVENLNLPKIEIPKVDIPKIKESINNSLIKRSPINYNFEEIERSTDKNPSISKTKHTNKFEKSIGYVYEGAKDSRTKFLTKKSISPTIKNIKENDLSFINYSNH
jgi:hypothetical protein